MIQVYYFDIKKHTDVLESTGKEFLCISDLERLEASLRKEKKAELIAAGWVKRYIFETILKKADYQKELRKTVYGKPFLGDKSTYFNMSGNSDFIVFVLCKESPIGVDVQRKRPFPGPAVRGFFFEEEWNHLFEHPDDFIRIWTRKEAYLKCIGTGWTKTPGCSVMPDCITSGKECCYCIIDMELVEDIVLSICYEGKEQQKEYRMEEITMVQLCQLKKREIRDREERHG